MDFPSRDSDHINTPSKKRKLLLPFVILIIRKFFYESEENEDDFNEIKDIEDDGRNGISFFVRIFSFY